MERRFANGKPKGAVSKAAACRHCEGATRSNPVIINYFRIASFRSQ
jgi:hypothetical protein